MNYDAWKAIERANGCELEAEADAYAREQRLEHEATEHASQTIGQILQEQEP